MFTKKKISVSIAGSKISSLSVKDHRISCKIMKDGAEGFGTMEMAIYGLPKSTMNTMTTLSWYQNYTTNNTIDVQAGDDETGLSQVYHGTIQMAWIDAQSMPKVCFRIQAMTGADDKNKQAEPTSVKGSAKATDLLGQIAGKLGLTPLFAGIEGMVLKNVYVARSAVEQFTEIARSIGAQHFIDDKSMVVTAPKSVRPDDTSPTISPTTGMVGYPGFNQNGIVVKTYFNPSIKVGGTITVQSELTPANGKWTVNNLVHELECEVPQGLWFTTCNCSKFGS
jgi:hypothetical protein